MDYSEYVVEGKGRNDLTPLFRDPQAFGAAVKDMVEPFRDKGITVVAGLDALGFVFGSAIAQELNVGLVLMRKAGKVPVEFESIDFTDYSGQAKKFEVAKSAIQENDVALIVDEWSETGSQLKAGISLLERMGAKVVGAACFNMDTKVTADPFLTKYQLHSLLTSGK